MTEPIRPPTLTLLSEGLLSKWGFNDGDAPDHLLDYWDDQGGPHGISDTELDWHAVLRILVRCHLLPELEKNHQITLVDIESSHNPVRADVVDGIDVDWRGGDSNITLPHCTSRSRTRTC